MPRNRRSSPDAVKINIESHPYNDRILPDLRVKLWVLDYVKDHMPAQDVMDGSVHGWTHILHMLVYASAFCLYADFDQNTVRWAIVCHDSGRYSDREESMHGLMGANVFQRMCIKAEEADSPLQVNHEEVMNIIARHSETAAASSTEEAVVRCCDRLDLWRIDGFRGINPELMEAPSWRKVERLARELRMEGQR